MLISCQYREYEHTNRICIIGDVICIFAFYVMILAKLSEFVKVHIDAIMLMAIVMLFILLSFAFGYIIAKYQDREPIQIEVRK